MKIVTEAFKMGDSMPAVLYVSFYENEEDRQNLNCKGKLFMSLPLNEGQGEGELLHKIMIPFGDYFYGVSFLHKGKRTQDLSKDASRKLWNELHEEGFGAVDNLCEEVDDTYKPVLER
jgi:hypothetical protein